MTLCTVTNLFKVSQSAQKVPGFPFAALEKRLWRGTVSVMDPSSNHGVSFGCKLGEVARCLSSNTLVACMDASVSVVNVSDGQF